MSPVVFRHAGFIFRFYANEGTPREPVHVHVVKDGIDAKFWLWPEVTLAYNDGHSERTIRQLSAIIADKRL